MIEMNAQGVARILTLSGLLAVGLAATTAAPAFAQMKETGLYNFCSQPNCADGAVPWFAGVIRDSAGNLYGTTSHGGDLFDCDQGCGTVFKLDTAGRLTVLQTFTGNCYYYDCTDGQNPNGVISDEAGNLYGTTFGGGVNFSGTIFKLEP